MQFMNLNTNILGAKVVYEFSSWKISFNSAWFSAPLGIAHMTHKSRQTNTHMKDSFRIPREYVNNLQIKLKYVIQRRSFRVDFITWILCEDYNLMCAGLWRSAVSYSVVKVWGCGGVRMFHNSQQPRPGPGLWRQHHYIATTTVRWADPAHQHRPGPGTANPDM